MPWLANHRSSRARKDSPTGPRVLLWQANGPHQLSVRWRSCFPEQRPVRSRRTIVARDNMVKPRPLTAGTVSFLVPFGWNSNRNE